jgi:hypothetical protein
MKDLMQFVKVYNDWFSKEECKKKVAELKKSKWDQHTFATYNEHDLNISGDKELYISYCDNYDNKYVMQRLWDGYYKYIQDLSLQFFNSWEGFSQVRYNRYSPGQTMAMHCDHIRTLFDGQRRGIPILSAVGLLNDNYKGGEFIMWEDEIKLKAGDLLVFPSAFVYPHLVNPVKSGTRYSLVAWSW